jgi:glyoxylase-like metal-dependent hydrolase (beta-lactamase superfamily II)
MLRIASLTCLVTLLWSALTPSGHAEEEIPVEVVAGGLTVIRGAVNGALIERDGKRLAVYGDPRAHPGRVEAVLFTHHRRDVAWAGRALVAAGARAIVPEAEVPEFAGVETFWSGFRRARFHDYAQRTTKVLAEPMPVSRSVRGGQGWTWAGLPIRILDTPGYTPGSITYLVELDGRRVAFTGDLIYGDGKLLDLYSLQDAIPELRLDAYHGFAARLGDVVASLRTVAAEHPDVLVPARGPLIRDPEAAIRTLIDRIRAVYANYLSIDAHRYYTTGDLFQAKARRVLDDGPPPGRLDAEVRDRLPDWIVPIENTRLIVASDRSGFVVDCGSQRILDTLRQLRDSGRLTTVEHAFVTHYHDDHTDQVASLVRTFGATVHATPENWDILEHPGAYRLPALTTNPVLVSGRARSGARWTWKELEMTAFDFPGQTLYHDALLVRKEGGEAVFFIGDSFTPSGIDDYCSANRNFLHAGMGYFRCLDLLQSTAAGAWLVNQHVGPAFRFSKDQLAQLRTTLEKRVELLRSLLPWDDPNFGLDEGWARFYPYAHAIRPGQDIRGTLRILNHSPAEQTFSVRLHLPPGWVLRSLAPSPLRVLAREEGSVGYEVSVPAGTPSGTYVLTADLSWDNHELREWTETLVTVTDSGQAETGP